MVRLLRNSWFWGITAVVPVVLLWVSVFYEVEPFLGPLSATFLSLVVAGAVFTKPTSEDVLHEGLEPSVSDRSVALIKQQIQKDFDVEKAGLTAELQTLRQQLNQKHSELATSQEKIRTRDEKIAEFKGTSLDTAGSTASAAQERIRILEDQLSERDEHLGSLENLLRHVLGLLPRIQKQMTAVIEHTETSALQIGDKVRYIYDKAQDHLAESNEINRQFSGKTANVSSEGKEYPSLSTVISSSLNLLKEMTEMLEENGRLNLDYSRSIEAILENTATINKITEDIQYISDQTNLLALNAAIEAARAGEHGRGFSVVAEEVRKLSDRTNQASNDITQIVGKVNDSVQAISESLTNNLRETESKKDSVNVAFSSLLESANESTDTFSKLVDSSVVSSESVAHNIDQIILSLQFQDITRQEIEAALTPIKQISNLSQEMLARIELTNQDTPRKGNLRPVPNQPKEAPAKTAKKAAPESPPVKQKQGEVLEFTQPQEQKEGEEDEGKAERGDVLFF